MMSLLEMLSMTNEEKNVMNGFNNIDSALLECVSILNQTIDSGELYSKNIKQVMIILERIHDDSKFYERYKKEFVEVGSDGD